MENWHEVSCRRADVIVIDAMPTCLSCGSFYSRDETYNFGELHKGQSQSEETSANLNLDWPPTIEFSSPDEVEDASIRDTLKRLGNILEEQQQRQQRFNQSREDNSETSPRPSGTGSHGDLLEKLNLGTSYDHKGAEQGQKEHPSKTTNDTKSVIYDPLTGVDEIRLLYLSPSKSTHDEALHGTLVTTSLSTRPIYTALSYTWANSDGSRSLSEEIFLGNLWAPLPITSNCAAALRRIRSGHEIKILWVDSICMDQLSTSEKSHQVGLMRDSKQPPDVILTLSRKRYLPSVVSFLLLSSKPFVRLWIQRHHGHMMGELFSPLFLKASALAL